MRGVNSALSFLYLVQDQLTAPVLRTVDCAIFGVGAAAFSIVNVWLQMKTEIVVIAGGWLRIRFVALSSPVAQDREASKHVACWVVPANLRLGLGTKSAFAFAEDLALTANFTYVV